MASWLFRYTLDDIESAYQAAAKAHSDQPHEIELKVRVHLGLGPTDPFPERDYDDDRIGRIYDEAGEMEERATRGAHLVRKAFLIALFHHWERYCNLRLRVRKYGHPRRWLKDRGHADCSSAILQLEHAANCAKHGPGRSCSNLYRARPDLFPRVRSADEATEALLVIEERTLEQFFAVVREASF